MGYAHYLERLPFAAAAVAGLAPYIRPAQRGDWPRLHSFLRAADVSPTGLSDHLDSLLILERGGSPLRSGEILGCVAVERGSPVLVRSLVVTRAAERQGYDLLLLRRALGLVAAPPAGEVILVVETTAQLPAQHLGLVLWDTLRRQRPDSALVRELSRFDSSALAVRLSPAARPPAGEIH